MIHAGLWKYLLPKSQLWNPEVIAELTAHLLPQFEHWYLPNHERFNHHRYKSFTMWYLLKDMTIQRISVHLLIIWSCLQGQARVITKPLRMISKLASGTSQRIALDRWWQALDTAKVPQILWTEILSMCIRVYSTAYVFSMMHWSCHGLWFPTHVFSVASYWAR